jgi:hypothetical protein
MKKINWLKVLGASVLIHIILILLSIIAVFIYSAIINPGQPKEIYEAFAPKIGPYVSAIGGFILVYAFVIRLNKNNDSNPLVIGLALPIIYIIIDMSIIISLVPDWSASLAAILISNGMKLSAGIIAAIRIKQSNKQLY